MRWFYFERSTPLDFAVAFVASWSLSLPACHEALGDPCDSDDACEQGLECRDGRCLPALPADPLDDIAVDEEISFDALEGPVEVLLDAHGTPRVAAGSAHDAWAVVGYLMARDRWPQLELRRRRALGTLATTGLAIEHAAVLGLVARLLRIEASAESAWEATPEGSPEAIALRAFADGVNAWLDAARRGDEPYPADAERLVADAEAWSPLDSLAIARLDALGRAFTADMELEVHLALERSLRDFTVDAPDADLARRAGFAEDVLRLDPVVETRLDHQESWLVDPPPPGAPVFAPHIDSPMFVDGWRGGLALLRELLGPPPDAAAAWVGNGRRGANGGGLLVASLSSPRERLPLYYAVALEWGSGGTRRRVAGLCASGVPALVAGFTDDLAWVDLPSGADLTDLYVERIETDGGRPAVRFDEAPVQIEEVQLVTATDGGEISLRTGYVPHHGPFVPAFDGAELSAGWNDVAGLTLREMAWSSSRPLSAAHALIDARSVEGAREILAAGTEPTSRWLLTDRQGSIGSVLPTCLPARDPRSLASTATRAATSSPVTVLPGDGAAEWRSCSELATSAPTTWVVDPASEVILALGADPLGATFDNDPFRDEHLYYGWTFEPGWRTAVVESALDASRRQRMDASAAFATLVADTTMAYASFVLALRRAYDRALHEREATGTEPDLMRTVNDLGSRLDRIGDALELLEAWDGSFARSSAEDAGAMTSAVIAGAWLQRLFRDVLSDELDLLDVRLADGIVLRALSGLLSAEISHRTAIPGTDESAIFDDLDTGSRFESRDDRLLRSLDATLSSLVGELGEDWTRWSWGELHRVRFRSPRWAGDDLSAETPIPGGVGSPFGCGPSLAADTLRCAGDVAGARLAVELRPWGPQAVVSMAGPQRISDLLINDSEALDAWSRGEHRELSFGLEEAVATATARLRFIPPEGG